jgi:hypothetical protein
MDHYGVVFLRTATEKTQLRLPLEHPLLKHTLPH